MAIIYVITNVLNTKQYIGKTNHSLNQRWQRHIADSKRENISNRPLYQAFQKYGIDNFTINQLEECSSTEASAREQYWIALLDTYHNGYNATLGGDGRQIHSYEAIYSFWKEGHTFQEVELYFNCTPKTVQLALNEFKVPISERIAHGLKYSTNKTKSSDKPAKPVIMLDKETQEILQIFNSQAEANIFLGKYRTDNSIGLVCRGKRQTAFGYKWAYYSK